MAYLAAEYHWPEVTWMGTVSVTTAGAAAKASYWAGAGERAKERDRCRGGCSGLRH